MSGRMDQIEIISLRTPPIRHTCKLPTWRDRRQHNIGLNTLVRCRLCGQRWGWFSSIFDGPHWEKVRIR